MKIDKNNIFNQLHIIKEIMDDVSRRVLFNETAHAYNLIKTALFIMESLPREVISGLKTCQNCNINPYIDNNPYVINHSHCNHEAEELIPEQDMSIFEVGNVLSSDKWPGNVTVLKGLHGDGLYFWGINTRGIDDLLHVERNGPWALVKKAEEIKPKAPAYVWENDKSEFFITAELYSSQEDADRHVIRIHNGVHLQWPALTDSVTGMYPGPK